MARLRELRDESAARESGDWGEEDPAALLDEVDRAIDELSGSMEHVDDNADFAGLGAPLETGQGDRLDTLSPDDFDARQAIEQGSTADDGVAEEAEDTEEAAEDLDAQTH